MRIAEVSRKRRGGQARRAATSSRPATTRPTATAMHRPSAGRAWRRAWRSSPRSAAQFAVPVLSDVHAARGGAAAAEVLDVLQIPAFLCRQTDLLSRPAQTGRPVNVKKGAVHGAGGHGLDVEKVRAAGNRGRAADRARHVLRLRPAGQRHDRHRRG